MKFFLFCCDDELWSRCCYQLLCWNMCSHTLSGSCSILMIRKVMCITIISVNVQQRFLGGHMFGDVSNVVCSRAAGYIGVDCSITEGSPPVITGVRVPVCDARALNPCTFVSLFLIQFTFTETFTCRFVSITDLWLKLNWYYCRTIEFEDNKGRCFVLQ